VGICVFRMIPTELFPILGQRTRTRVWGPAGTEARERDRMHLLFGVRGGEAKWTFPINKRTDGGGRGRKPYETNVNLSIHTIILRKM